MIRSYVLLYLISLNLRMKNISVKIKGLNNVINEIKSGIDNLDKSVLRVECAIEGVTRNLILCTLQSANNSILRVMNNNLGVLEVDRLVMNIYGVSNVMDYKVVINRLFESAKKIDHILQLIPSPDCCLCIWELESKTTKIELKQINVQKIIQEITKQTKSDDLEFDDLRKIHQMRVGGNHLCLCMVFKYSLYPGIVKTSCGILGIDLDALSALSRKFQNYSNSTGLKADVSPLLIMISHVFNSISNWVIKNYPYAWTGWTTRVDIKCYCTHNDDPNYSRVVSTILVLSSLIENIWTMDPETLRTAIEKLSVLYSQLDKIDSQNNKSICNNNMYSLIVNKECQPKTEKCCCCWCVAAFNLGMILIYLSFQCKLCKALCTKKEEKPNGCKDLKKWFELKDCDCKCQQKENGVCCLLKLAACSQAQSTTGEGCKSLQEALDKCCPTCGENGCCAEFFKKVKAGLCKVLLLRCECDCTTDTGTGEFKVKCVFFNDLNERTRVAVVVFCKCVEPPKCCCLIQLINNFETKLGDNLCQDQKCVCEKLKDVCQQICGTDCTECVCKTLKDAWNKICNGTTTNCGGAAKCLCKKIEKLKPCFTNKECECKNKGGCCRCVCCKLVGASIKILTRACRANMLEPYKRIALDLMASSKNKKEPTNTIIERINNGTVNRLYLLKNNLLTSTINVSTNPLNTVKSRNWGYDTQHEHHLTTHQGIDKSDGYPHINTSDGTRDSNNRNKKMFKMNDIKLNTL